MFVLEMPVSRWKLGFSSHSENLHLFLKHPAAREGGKWQWPDDPLELPPPISMMTIERKARMSQTPYLPSHVVLSPNLQALSELEKAQPGFLKDRVGLVQSCVLKGSGEARMDTVGWGNMSSGISLLLPRKLYLPGTAGTNVARRGGGEEWMSCDPIWLPELCKYVRSWARS